MNNMLVRKTPGPLYAEPAFSDVDGLLRPVKKLLSLQFFCFAEESENVLLFQECILASRQYLMGSVFFGKKKDVFVFCGFSNRIQDKNNGEEVYVDGDF